MDSLYHSSVAVHSILAYIACSEIPNSEQSSRSRSRCRSLLEWYTVVASSCSSSSSSIEQWRWTASKWKLVDWYHLVDRLHQAIALLIFFFRRTQLPFCIR